MTPYFEDPMVQIFHGNVIDVLRGLPEESVDTCVTSPPYWGLRNYGIPDQIWGGDPAHEHVWGSSVLVNGTNHTDKRRWNHTRNGRGEEQPKDKQVSELRPEVDQGCFCECGAWRGSLGLEPTPYLFVEHMVTVFREVHRVLKPEGTCWLNLGDSYATGGGTVGDRPGGGAQGDKWSGYRGGHDKDPKAAGIGPMTQPNRMPIEGLKPKDLVGVPWRVAFALQADGWWLRSDIIWCLSGGAWLYARTQKGDMPMMVKDMVRLDPSTVKLWNGTKWTQALGWSRTWDESEKIELVLRSGERIGCTGGHQWPTSRGNIAARDLAIGDVIDSCTLPEPDNCVCPEYITLDALWFVGLFLAEGSRSGDMIQLALNADEMRWVPRLEKVAAYYGGSCSDTLDGNCLIVRMWGRVLNAIIDTYVAPGDQHVRHLKTASWSLPNNYLREIIVGYLAGDGHSDPQNDRVRLGFCRNYSLERDLRTLAARLGATLTLKPVVATGFGRQFPAFRGEWRWTRSGYFNERSRSEIVEIRASRARKFWDIGVEDEPHLFALASGVLTHNSKPAPMPESVTDRPTRSHEYIFLLAKSEKYYYDSEAIKEPSVSDHSSGNGYKRDARLSFADENGARGSDEKWQPKQPKRWNGSMFDGQRDLIVHPDVGRKPRTAKNAAMEPQHSGRRMVENMARARAEGADHDSPFGDTRNKRDVWTINTEPFPEAHFAVFPSALVLPCVLAGCPVGGTVLDPFSGAGTTALVAKANGRRAIGIELNEDYIRISDKRLRQDSLAF